MIKSSLLTVVYGRNPRMNEDGGEAWLLDICGGRAARHPVLSDADWCRAHIAEMGVVEGLFGIDSDAEPALVANATKVIVRGWMRCSRHDYGEADVWFEVEHVGILDPEPFCVGCYVAHVRTDCPELGTVGA